MKKFITILSIFLLVFTLSGCGGSSTQSNACAAGNPEVILVTDTGGVNDKSFNQGAWEGIIKSCEQLGIGAQYIESQNESELEGNLRTASEQANIVIASGFNFEKAIAKVAPEFPDTQYVFIDGQPTDADGNKLELANVYSYFFNETQAGYLVGYIAGKVTKTNKIGYVGGLEIPPVQKFGWGFIQGAQAANPNVSISYEYTNSFTDTTKGKNVANAMIADNVDIIFTAAGGLNNGVVEAAINSTNSGQPIYVIGVDRDMYEDGIYNNDQSVILTSAVKNVGEATFSAVKTIKEGGTLLPINNLDFAGGYVGLPEENPNLVDYPEVVQEAKDSLNQAVANGTLQDNVEGLQANLQITVNGKY